MDFVQGDITDLATVERALDEYGITNVIHLAALQVPFCRADPPLGAQVNVTGTVNVFEAVKRRGDGMAPVVYTGSIGMFSPSDVDPVTGRLEEDADAHPGNHYGVYKLANEGSARIYWVDSGVPSVGLRPMTVYGAGRDQGMTSTPTVAIAAAVLGVPYEISFGGRTLFQYAEDVAATLVLASRSAPDGPRVYNLGGSQVALDEWVAAIETAVPEAAGLITVAPTELPFPGGHRPWSAGGARRRAGHALPGRDRRDRSDLSPPGRRRAAQRRRARDRDRAGAGSSVMDDGAGLR